MIDEYDYFVHVEKLNPPLGKNKFAAKVPYVVKNPGDNFERVYPQFHEWWGETSEEAESKAKAEADKWIAQQQNDNK
jgi:hypothetical protein